MICSDNWHKYHEWYFAIVVRKKLRHKRKFQPSNNIIKQKKKKEQPLDFRAWLRRAFTANGKREMIEAENFSE